MTSSKIKCGLLALIALAMLASSPGQASAFSWEKGIVQDDLNGYFKNLVTVSDTKDVYKDLDIVDKRWFLDMYNRFRVKNQFRLSDVFMLQVDYEAFISTGDTQRANYRIDQLTKRYAALAQAAGIDVESPFAFLRVQPAPRFLDMEEELSISGGQKMAHNIDRLFFRLNSRYVYFEGGRMALSWGTGRLWNPTDMWSPFSPTQIDKDEKRGVDLVHLGFEIPKVGSLEGVYAPLSLEDHYEIDGDASSAGGRFRFHIGEYDFSVMAGDFGKDVVTGFDWTGYIGGAGFRGEATYTFVEPEAENRTDEDEDYIRALLSVDYGFAVWGNPTILVEGFYNGLGTADSDEYMDQLSQPRVQRMALMGRSFNIGRDYLAAMFTLMPHPLVTTTLMPIMNLDDQSVFVSLTALYSVTDFAELIAGVNLALGGENTEYGGLEVDQIDPLLKTPDLYYLYLKAYF